MTAESESPAELRFVPRLLVVAGALHLALLAYFTPLGVVLRKAPFATFDYALHVYQVDRACRAFETTGHLWSYDPFALAGHPAGALEDLTIRSLELFVIGARHLGMATWVAFDLYVLLVHLAVPCVAWASARAFGFSRLTSAIAVLAWVVLWWFDSLLHWFWYVGMISWGLASQLVVLAVATMYRATTQRTLAAYAALCFVSVLVTCVHPFAVVALALPLVALYARVFRSLRPREHVALVVIAMAAAATTATWLAPALRFRHLVGRIDLFLMPAPSYLLSDFLDLLRDVLQTGEPVRTAFRTLAFFLAAARLVQLSRLRDARVLPLVLLVVGSVALAYLSGASTVLSQTQPYRNLGPAILAAALVAADGVPQLAISRNDRFDAAGRAVVVLGAALALPTLLRTMVSTLPSLLPGGPELRAAPRERARFGRELDPVVMGHAAAPPEYDEVARYLDAHFANVGRVAVTDWALGEWLVAFSHVPILGGIPQRYVPQTAAHPLRVNLVPTHDGDDPLAGYLERYAVAAVVVNGPPSPFDRRGDLLEPAEGIGPYRVYRSRRPPNYFASGSGTVETQALDSIRVRAVPGEDVVLRFHHLETLRCRPNCRVERAEDPLDAAGFIRVRKSPAVFEIVNAFE